MIAASSYDYDDIGICLDSCHLFAGGYDFRTEAGLTDMMDSLADEIGLENVHYLHLNDSKHPFDSEKDEHEHIGEGEIGKDGFRLLINDPNFRELPMALETPEDSKDYEWNIERIRELRD
jgi:deoxyribonuclease-4